MIGNGNNNGEFPGEFFGGLPCTRGIVRRHDSLADLESISASRQENVIG